VQLLKAQLLLHVRDFLLVKIISTNVSVIACLQGQTRMLRLHRYDLITFILCLIIPFLFSSQCQYMQVKLSRYHHADAKEERM
jgi:hypothetical protein